MNFGKIIIIVGLILVIVGLFLTFGFKIPYLGKLPGDFSYRNNSFSFYFPLMSSILVSIILTIVLNIVARLSR